jgi:hypothetical protein
MLLIDCPTHGSPVLVPVTRIRALDNTGDGIFVLVDCWCGTQVRLHTGARVRAQTYSPVPGR